MNNLMIFEGKNVEVFEHKGQVLFNPKHVAECLDIKDVNSVIRNFNEKQLIKLRNSDMHTMHIRRLNNAGENFLTESGVYKLIFKSRKEEAERFQDWVTDEVLPSIRANGIYAFNGVSKEIQAIFELDRKQQRTDERVDYLYNNMTVDYEQQEELLNEAKRRAIEILGGYNSNAYKKVSKKVFSAIWRDYKSHFKINSYKNTAIKDFENGLMYLANWKPNYNLSLEISTFINQIEFAG